MPWYTDFAQHEAQAGCRRAGGGYGTDPRVRIMCHIGASGVRDCDRAAWCPSELTIALPPVARNSRWQDDREMSGNDCREPFTWTAAKLQGFAAQGLAPIIHARRGLPDRTVICHAESRIPARPRTAGLAGLRGPGKVALPHCCDVHRPRSVYKVAGAIVTSGRPPDTD